MKLRMTIDFEDMPFRGIDLNGTTSVEYDSDTNVLFTPDNNLYNISDNNSHIKGALEREIQLSLMSLAECRKMGKSFVIVPTISTTKED